MASNIITVTGAHPAEKEPYPVILWEKDDRHPDGEVFISDDGKSHRVFETAAIKRLIGEERLVKAEAKPTFAKPSTFTPEEPKK